jgi:dTDP-3-amino-3,4,6-trideoxy-alpha-D-glucose transaminase
MRIPVANLKPQIEQVRAAFFAHLEETLAIPHLILGPQGGAFEAAFAAATGAIGVAACGNGTAAIELCLRARSLTRSSDEVITTPLTAPFTGIGITGAGASIRFADIDPLTLLLDPDDAGNRATRRTRAIVPVHLYGHPCPMEKFRTLARRLTAVLIQDAAQAHGASYRGKPLTAFSPYVTYSFYPTKNLGCLGDGGAIATATPSAAARLRSLRDGGRQPGSPAMVSQLRGINSRLDEIQACYLRASLPCLADWNARREKIAALYDEALAGCSNVTLIPRPPGSVNHLYVIRVRKRDRLRGHLTAAGIGTAIHYPVPLHLHPAFSDCGLKRGDLPHAELACKEVLSLPLWPHLPLSQAEEVAAAVRHYC